MSASIFETIDTIAREFARVPHASRCECEHIQDMHSNRWGRCAGGHWQCPCQGFRAFHHYNYREYVRIMTALVVRLGLIPEPKPADMPTYYGA